MLKFKPCLEWDDKHYKHSHERKTLIEHVEETKSLLRTLIDFYGDFPRICLDAGVYLAEYHDQGKLCRLWRLGKGKPHSPWSIQWLMNKKRFFTPRVEFTWLLWYLIMKHHSKLTDITFIPNGKYIVEEARNLIEKLSFKEKVNLVDTFGLFKIADVLSASGRCFKPEAPLVSENEVRKVIGRPIDEGRWRQQLNLQTLGDVGILRAYTGWGKTDASLLYIVNKHPRKVFYLLPTITAISKFHGKLTNAFPNKVGKYFFFYDAELSEEDEKLHELFIAENYLFPIVITTVDQFLLSFLQYGKYHSKRVMFRNSCLIFDEVHLLNPLMLNLTIYFLNKYIDLYRVKTLFMSATLSNALYNFLKDEIKVKMSFLDYSDEYYHRRRILLNYKPNVLEKDVDEIKRSLEEGKKVLIISNTVEKAVKLARLLEKEVSREKIILLHSRFMFKDRRSKEMEIEEKTRKPHVLISTQVSEVSLDISYNLLFTELAPFPSLMQRFGRVNRYGTATDKVNVYIYEPEIRSYEHYPYGKRDIDIARKIIEEIEGENLRNEGQLLNLFNDVYTYDDLLKELEGVKRKVNVKAFEDELNFFYSFDVQEEKLMKVLRYRDSFNVLVIPDPSSIIDEDSKNDVEQAIQPLRKPSFSEKAKIKNVLVSVPVWWIKRESCLENVPYPVAGFKGKVYDKRYGLVDKKVF